MIVYRITSAKYARQLNGKGAAQSNSNRWNSKGTEMLYTAESEGLARAELSGHINIALLPDPVLIEIEIPEFDIHEIKPLPQDWSRIPPASSSKRIGDRFILENKYLGVKVPSRYDVLQYNYLLNPHFKEFDEKVKIVDITGLK